MHQVTKTHWPMALPAIRLPSSTKSPTVRPPLRTDPGTTPESCRHQRRRTSRQTKTDSPKNTARSNGLRFRSGPANPRNTHHDATTARRRKMEAEPRLRASKTHQHTKADFCKRLLCPAAMTRFTAAGAKSSKEGAAAACHALSVSRQRHVSSHQKATVSEHGHDALVSPKPFKMPRSETCQRRTTPHCTPKARCNASGRNGERNARKKP